MQIRHNVNPSCSVNKNMCGQIKEKRYMIMSNQEVRRPVLDKSRFGCELNIRHIESSFDSRLGFMPYLSGQPRTKKVEKKVEIRDNTPENKK